MNLVEKAYRAGEEVSGPLFTPYINWVVEQSRQRGVDHILYMARDGQLFQKITQSCIDLHGMQSHYVYAGSRSSWYRCTPYLLSARVLDFRIRTEFFNLEKTCEALGVDNREFSGQFDCDPYAVLSELQIGQVARYFSSASGKGRLYELTEPNRGLFIDYLRQFEIRDRQKVSIVDVGWNGNFQTSLESMLHPLGINISGYYFGLNHSIPGSYRKWFLYGPGKIPHWLRFYPCLVETLTPADHGSVSALRSTGSAVEPVISGPSIADSEIIHALQDGALSFARKGAGKTGDFDFKSIVEDPPVYLIDLLSEFYFQKPFSPDGRESFIRKHSTGDAIKLSFAFKRKLDNWHWPQANLQDSGLAWLKYGLNGRFALGFILERYRNKVRVTLRKLRDLLAALMRNPFSKKDYGLVSFDIFDTLLRRECGGYKGIFETVGKEIGRDDFPELRKMTETRLLRRRNMEITIDEVYEELHRMEPALDWEHVKQLELETEAENLKRAGRAVRFLDRTRKTPAKVVFISDMYLGSDWIREQLIKHGIWQEGDKLFVSCDVGANKRTREIYWHVRELYPDTDWLHVGDNLIVDIVNAHKEGIDVRWLPNSYRHSVVTHAGRILSRFSG